MSEQAFQILSSKKWTGSSSICIRTTKKPATSPTNTDLLTEEDKKKLFPGLSKPDQDWQPFNGEGDGDEKVDDMMSGYGGQRSFTTSKLGERSLRKTT